MLVAVIIHYNKDRKEYQNYIEFDTRLTYQERLFMVEVMEEMLDADIYIDPSDKELFKKGYNLKELLVTAKPN